MKLIRIKKRKEEQESEGGEGRTLLLALGRVRVIYFATAWRVLAAACYYNGRLGSLNGYPDKASPVKQLRRGKDGLNEPGSLGSEGASPCLLNLRLGFCACLARVNRRLHLFVRGADGADGRTSLAVFWADGWSRRHRGSGKEDGTGQIGHAELFSGLW